MTKHEFRKWRTWIRRIVGEIRTTVNDLRLWNEIRAMWRTNPGLRVASDAPPRLWRWHAFALCLTIRRQVDTDDRVVSLGRLLQQLERAPHLVTRQTYVRRAKSGMLRRSSHSYFNKWARGRRIHLDPAIPRRDLARLHAFTKRVRQFVDRVLAHSQSTSQTTSPSLLEMRKALRAVEQIALRYYTLLTGAALVDGSLVETRQFNHETIWRRPWLGPQWRVPSWPPERVERHGELWPTPDYLSKSEHRRLVRQRSPLVAGLRESFDWDRTPPSPLRRALETRSLPATDAAVQWLRDQLAKEGAVWTTGPGGD